MAIAMRFVAAFGLIGAADCFYMGTLSGLAFNYFSAVALVVVSIWMFYQASATNRRLRQRLEKLNLPPAHERQEMEAKLRGE